jgi:guanylate kinase
MTMYGLILYGPPAAGKDTVTRALTSLDSRYVLFPRLKVGHGRTSGYRMAKTQDIVALRARGEVVWENRRYESLYVIDRPFLLQELAIRVPVLHLGQSAAIDAVSAATPSAKWFITELWCPEDIATARIEQRQTGDTAARVAAWRETEPLQHPDLRIDTSETSPEAAATQVRQLLPTTS